MLKVIKCINKGFPSVFLCVVFASIGSYFFLPSKGIISCMPLIAVCTIVPALFIKNYFYFPILFFTITYLFSFSIDIPLRFTNSPGGFSLFISVFAAVISMLSCFAVTLIKKAKKQKQKKSVYIAYSSLLILFLLFSSAPLNGNIFSAQKAKTKIENSIEDHFYRSELSVGDIYYSPFTNAYSIDVSVKGYDKKASFCYKNSVVSNSLTQLATDIAGNETALKITNILRSNYIDDTFEIHPTLKSNVPFRLSLFNSGELLPYIEYTITINSEEKASSFIEKVRDYLSVFEHECIQCNKITFVGGAKQKLFYRLSVNMGSPHADISELLKPYDKTIDLIS